MKLDKNQTDGFSKILKRGMEHYNNVPYALAVLEGAESAGVIGVVSWLDPTSNYTTSQGDTKQEFYIQLDGTICTYTDKQFVPVDFKKKNWDKFRNYEGDIV